LDLGVENDLIQKRGSYYSYGETRLGQGRENAKEYLRHNPDLANELDVAIRINYGLMQGENEEEIEEVEVPELALESESG
ncbi:MAG: DNA recombination/repair protein RecA, partial [Anaerolineales bacterium]